MATKTRVVLHLNTRVKVIHASERDKLSVKQIMKMFNVGKTQVYEILKKKTEILMWWENCGNGKIKRELKKTANEDVNEVVWEWFVSVRAKNHSVSGPMVQEYAKKVAQKLGKTEFKASNGWLESFRKRHQIVFNELCGESSDVNSEAIEECVAKLPSIIQGYEPENIANGDETGLFFRALPNKRLYLKGEKCSGGKLCKERLTVFLCGFMSGETEKPLVIGKSAKPRCFRNQDLRKLPVEWRANKKTWVTSHIMEEWLTAFKEEEENDIVLEEEKCRLKTYRDAVKSLKDLQEFAVQRNDSDMLGVISQAKVIVEIQAARRVNCVQKPLLDYWKK